MKGVRFAPSPTRPLHLGNALGPFGGRVLGDWMLPRIDEAMRRLDAAL
jgi:hypothetical protein